MQVVLFLVAIGLSIASGSAAETYTHSPEVGAVVGYGLVALLLGMQSAARMIATARK